GFRGRCYHGNAIDANDGCPQCPCPNGGAAGGSAADGSAANGITAKGGSIARSAAAGAGAAGGSVARGDAGHRCSDCSDSNGNRERGMPIWKISEPYLNVWLSDSPLNYTS